MQQWLRQSRGRYLIGFSSLNLIEFDGYIVIFSNTTPKMSLLKMLALLIAVLIMIYFIAGVVLILFILYSL